MVLLGRMFRLFAPLTWESWDWDGGITTFMDELELDEAVCSGPLAMESCEADSKLKL